LPARRLDLESRNGSNKEPVCRSAMRWHHECSPGFTWPVENPRDDNSVGNIVRASRPGSSAAKEKCSPTANWRVARPRPNVMRGCYAPRTYGEGDDPQVVQYRGTWRAFEGRGDVHRRRTKEMISLRLSCYPAEIESVISTNPRRVQMPSSDGRWTAMKRSLRCPADCESSEVTTT